VGRDQGHREREREREIVFGGIFREGESEREKSDTEIRDPRERESTSH
jgi:hypothetical protein